MAPRALTDEERQIVAQADQDAPVLERLRAAAAGWVTTIGLLTAAFSIAATFGFAFDFILLDNDQQDLVKIAIFAAIVAVVLAIILGAIASQGWPTNQIEGDELETARQRIRQAKSAAGLLLASRISAGVAALCFLAVLWFSLWGERDDPAYVYTIVAATPSEGAVACGVLITDEESGDLSLDQVGSGATEVAITDYAKLTKLEDASCPGIEEEE
jgi:MFS family permease